MRIFFTFISALGLLAACGSSDAISTITVRNDVQSGAQDIGVFRAILRAGQLPDPSVLSPTGFFAEHSLPASAICSDALCVQSSLAVAPRFDGSTWTMASVSLRANPVATQVPIHYVLALESGLLRQDEWLDLWRAMQTSLRDGDQISIYKLAATLEVVAENLTRDSEPPSLSQQVIVPELYPCLRQLRDRVRMFARPERAHVFLITSGLRATSSTVTAQLGDEDSIVRVLRGISNTGVLFSLVGLSRHQNEGAQGNDFDPFLPSLLAGANVGPTYFAESRLRLQSILTEELQSPSQVVARDITVRVRAGDAYNVTGSLGAPVSVSLPGEKTFQIPVFWARMSTTAQRAHQTLFVELSANMIAAVVENETAFAVELRYHDAAGVEHTTSEQVRNPLRPGLASVDGSTRFSSAQVSSNPSRPFVMWNAYQTMRVGLDFFASGDCARAQGTFSMALPVLETWRTRLPVDDASRDIDLVSEVSRAVQTRCRTRSNGAAILPRGETQLANISAN